MSSPAVVAAGFSRAHLRRGTATQIGVFILVASVVAGGVILNFYSMGVLSRLPAVKQVEEIKLDKAAIQAPMVYVNVRNSGGMPVEVDRLYFDGILYTEAGGLTINTPSMTDNMIHPGEVAVLTLNLHTIQPKPYDCKVTSKDGCSTTFTVVSASSSPPPPPPKYDLEIGSQPVEGFLLLLGDQTITTPNTYQLDPGEYTLVAPRRVRIDGAFFVFQRWSNGETSRTVTINLTQDTSISAVYEERRRSRD